MAKWTTDDIPSLNGKTAMVTGTGGLGYEDALALAKAGAKVIIAGRDATKGEQAVKNILNIVSGAEVRFALIDLADLSSVEQFAPSIKEEISQLDIIINNAGVMTPPNRLETKDGFELQFGTNYLGHFALVMHLLPLLTRSNARVISLSSIAARRGRIAFDDLQSLKNYNPMVAYSQSKLACLMFAFELQKRSDANGWGLTSIAAHPGLSRTDLLTRHSGNASLTGIARNYAWFMFQPVAKGALSTLYAATYGDAKPGGYYGPSKLYETRGNPKEAHIPKRALEVDSCSKLWDESERLIGSNFI